MKITTDWKDVKGYEGIYQVHYNGSIRRITKNGYRSLKPFRKSSARIERWIVHLTHSNGKLKEVNVAKIIAENFIGECPQGYVPYHINGVQSDNYYTNIAYISRKELGKLTAYKAKSKRVAKIDKFGEIIDIYMSARDCARKVKSNRQVITDYCNGNRKKPFNKNFDFAWEENACSIRKAMERLNSKPQPYKGKRCRTVYAFDKSGNFINEFNSIAEASRKLFYSPGFIRDCCRGRRNCNDYIFRFEKESDINVLSKRKASKSNRIAK